MPAPSRRARDLDLLDALDACPREAFSGAVWRVVREGRDPLLGAASKSRWCDGAFDVLYTSFEREGALAEVHAFLSLQPVLPSKISWRDYELTAATEKTLVFADLTALGRIGVEAATYRERDYARTQAIADAAFFLGFDGLIAPSARWSCQNLVLFTDRLAPEKLAVTSQGAQPIDWAAWRKRNR
jgi:hypothetical protein